MQPPRFTSATEAALRAAGWFPERTVPLEQMDSWLVLNIFAEIAPPRGYLKISPKAWHVLHEFGGLTIERNAGLNGSKPLVLNPLRVVNCYWTAEYWENIEWTFGEQLFPLGTIAVKGEDYEDEYSPLYIGNRGHVYVFWDEPRLLGNSFEETLENLVAGELGEIIQAPDWDKIRDITIAIQKRIDERERALLRGDWPQQEIALWKDELARSNDPIDWANMDWKAEATRVARAFGIAESCVFVGPALWRALLLTNNPDRREWEYQRPPLGEGYILRANYRPGLLMFKIASASLHTLAAAEFSSNGYSRGDGHRRSRAAQILAKGLFCLGYLTPEIEKGLQVDFSQHEKLEWQLAFDKAAIA